ncbi:hypothetical protein A2856_03705 [Candidatus Uhrbacteria bacterium RIFCSPHIGHO2_01_FULL_63_20]|uniref:Uncharacterized protein n=1 Tax=Candidatus Uhrbacteria bacterium RIFCSPHIGHO2_01_FULL_63_20 TaxID=1802385 RepID=A0A1F7TME6_9BACT|nr:MAG: hypothetical protein A2856_03705 [Candidatus Uhrbacteria bacterium RIFCSPHIGHO2_01_FULL_63_20]
MADAPTIQTPAGAIASSKTSVAFFVMPEKYRGGAQAMTQPKPPAPVTAPVAVAPPPPPKPAAPTGKPVPMKKKSKTPTILLIVGLALLASLGFGAYFLLRPTTPAVTTPSPRPVPTPTPTPTPPPPEPEPEPVPIPGADQDGDGLTDIEERLIYGSDPANTDTDADGYPDALEVENRYNPAAVAPRTLLEAGVVRLLEEGPGGPLAYAILYPTGWSVAVADDSASVTFTAPTGETVTFRSDLGTFATDLGIKTTVDYGKTIEMMTNSLTTRQEP